jgi:hypothetical protein
MTLADILSDLFCTAGGYALCDAVARLRRRHAPQPKKPPGRQRCDANKNPAHRGTCPNFAEPGCETGNCPKHCVKYCRCGVGVEP